VTRSLREESRSSSKSRCYARIRQGEDQAGVGRHVLLQELHLVVEDPPVRQDQVLGLFGT